MQENPFKVGDKIVAITDKKDYWPNHPWDEHLFSGGWCKKNEVLTVIRVSSSTVCIDYKPNGKCRTYWWYFRKAEKKLRDKLLKIILS